MQVAIRSNAIPRFWHQTKKANMNQSVTHQNGMILKLCTRADIDKPAFSKEQLDVFELVERYLIEVKEYVTTVASSSREVKLKKNIEYPKPFHVFVPRSGRQRTIIFDC